MPFTWIDIIVPHNILSKNALEKWTLTTIVKDCPYWTCSRLSSDEMFLGLIGKKVTELMANLQTGHRIKFNL